MIKKTRNQKINKLETKAEKTVFKQENSVEILGLHNLSAPKGMNKRKKILGRGPGSGHGKTSTRGSKGQTSRAGRDMYLGFEGGQTPLIRRMPKRGFVNKFKKTFQIISLEALKNIEEVVITPEILEKKGLIKDKNKSVKILSDGQIKKGITIQAHAFSKKAQDKILEAGGKFEVLNV